MDSVTCPFCDLLVSSSELQWHANSHFEDEQEEQPPLARGLELVSSSYNWPPSPKSRLSYDLGFDQASSSGSGCGNREKVDCLVHLQIRSDFHQIDGGLMVLLRKCLESEPESTISVLSGYADHFHCIESEDVGWGCGWRNVQMLTSHLLAQRQEAKEVLFGGSGFVPDIPSLQRWLEIAWEKGFDEPGSEHFDSRIYGTKKWIGTTECAALLRSFGLRAMVVDFGPKEFEPLYLSAPGSSLGGKKRGIEVFGPMDRFVVRKNNGLWRDRSVQEKSGCLTSTTKIGDSSRESKDRQVLIDWVWSYFSDEKPINYGNRRVIVTEKAPLYFQHNGHSRTIVGVQVNYQRKGTPQYTLLILDPAHGTAALEKSLKQNVGWQKLIKRGFHTLKKPQYQLCYVDPGISTVEELESLKTINSMFYEI